MGTFLLSLSPFIYVLFCCLFFLSCVCSGSAHVKVLNLLRALQANRSLSVHSHMQGKIQTNKVKVAVLISGTGESCILYYSVKQIIEKGTSAQIQNLFRSLQLSVKALVGF